VGAPALKRALWLAAALLAAGVIVALALHGSRPDPSLARFEAAGVMLSIPPDTVTEVIVSQGERRWRFERADNSHPWNAAPRSPSGDNAGARIESGLRFLHASAPQRVLQPEETAGIAPSEFGLAPPRFSVFVRSSAAKPFSIDFGALSPQGLAQYAHVSGRPQILLLPSFVGEPWDALIGSR
jgi:hypothetical protein